MLALDRPLIGGGYGVIHDAERYRRYVPEQTTAFVFHSIYFDMLGYHGFVGLGLFLALGFSGYFVASGVIRRCRDAPEQRWASDLAQMVQVSLVGFAVGGAFLSLHLFEMFYDLLAIVVGLRVVTAAASETSQAGQGSPSVWTPPLSRLTRRL
jgi:probable O-glycosylation ligase (exosortase A-associated)